MAEIFDQKFLKNKFSLKLNNNQVTKTKFQETNKTEKKAIKNMFNNL